MTARVPLLSDEEIERNRYSPKGVAFIYEAERAKLLTLIERLGSLRDTLLSERNNYETCIEERDAEIERQSERLKEFERAIGEHSAPEDCFATGPMTGDSFRDLIQCPACSALAIYRALKIPMPEKHEEKESEWSNAKIAALKSDFARCADGIEDALAELDTVEGRKP